MKTRFFTKLALAFMAVFGAASVSYANTDYSKLDANDISRLCEMGDNNACNYAQNAKLQACEKNNDVNACFEIGNSYTEAYERAIKANDLIEKRKRFGKSTEGMRKTPEADINKMLSTAIFGYTKVCEKDVPLGCERLGIIYTRLTPDKDKALANFEKTCNICLTILENGRNEGIKMLAGSSCTETINIYKSRKNFAKALDYEKRAQAQGAIEKKIDW